MKHKLHRRFLGWLVCLVAMPAWALSPEELLARLKTRWEGDRTGACVLAAMTDAAGTVRARLCAQPRANGGPGYDHAFEIGSISKTMTAFLVARLIEQGRWSLDDPIALHLPTGSSVPQQGERQILVRDLVTHRASLPGLPPGFAPRNPQDPYADTTEAGVLQALARTPLNAPLGSRSQYSNFGMMVLSLAVSRSYGGDLEAALRQELWQPLGMQRTHIARRTADSTVVPGRVPSGATTAAWNITPNLAGMGMVKASLDDMVRYARLAAGLDLEPVAGPMAGPAAGQVAAQVAGSVAAPVTGSPASTALATTMRRSQVRVAGDMGMNWFLDTVAGRPLVTHSGATGGFSSTLVAEPGARRAVVLLADTSLTNLGGLQGLANSLLDLPARTSGGAAARAETPRWAVPMPPALRQALIGDYELAGLSARVYEDAGRVMAQATGQPPMELKADSHGDVYTDAVDALLTPVIEGGRMVRFRWHQGGGLLEGVRKGALTALTAIKPEWQPWAGEYQLAPGFTLKVFEREGKLMLQATGQSAFEAEVVGADRIAVTRFGAEVQFLRAADGRVRAAVLHQGGRVIEGERLPAVAAKP
jgi:serine-type D-Ala-D-Ala carboxypeptidase/endopeptidase